jgi:hypothetical protein
MQQVMPTDFNLNLCHALKALLPQRLGENLVGLLVG